jgi:hypothetical protein
MSSPPTARTHRAWARQRGMLVYMYGDAEPPARVLASMAHARRSARGPSARGEREVCVSVVPGRRGAGGMGCSEWSYEVEARQPSQPSREVPASLAEQAHGAGQEH